MDEKFILGKKNILRTLCTSVAEKIQKQTSEKPSSTWRVGELRFIMLVVPEELVL